MELSIYDVIVGTITTPKSLELRKKYGKITFKVNQNANKVLIREAVEKIWEVKVRDVRIVNLHGKTKVVARKNFKRPDTKKAIVTLKPGYKIDLPDQFETMGLDQSKSKTVAEGGE